MAAEKKKTFLLIFCFSIIGPAFLAAQSTAQEIENLLEQRAVTYLQAARFVVEAADLMPFSNPMRAFHFAEERGWLPRNSSPNQTARLDGLSLLVMRAFGIRGGVMYSITHAPRFAYRELVYYGIIQGRAAPNMAVSGYDLLFIINRVLSHTEQGGIWAEDAALHREKIAAELREANIRRNAEREALAARINQQLEEHMVEDTFTMVTNEGVTIILSNILFLADSAELPGPLMAKLHEITRIIRDIPRAGILVGGHTALAGTVESMLEVSYARAIGVADYLVAIGAGNASEIQAVGYGADRPVASNETPEGMAANRRVEITIIEEN
jgi:outer membrane protein OmpA-like peptidoglycan-associated protein